MTRRAIGRFRPAAPASAAGALALLVGLGALAFPPQWAGEQPTWEALLAPYSTGTPLPNGSRIRSIRRGADNGVVVSVGSDADAVEVLVVERGRWKSDGESQSFTIDYELPHSPAPDREVVTALLAETIRARDHGLPSPDAIALRAGDAAVMPWWLEMLRGLRGTLFGASLVVLALIVLHDSPGLGWAGVALGVTALIARLAGVPLVRADIGALWTMPASAALIVFAMRGRGSRPATALFPALSVAGLGLILRLVLGPWGPLHVNGHGARFVAGAAGDPADIAAYGPGYAEIFAPIAALAPSSPDWAIFACNALLSALLPPLAFAIAGMTGVAGSGAFVAALLLAIDPVAIRMGATEGYFAAIAFLGAGASAAMLLALREMEAGGRWRATAALVSAGLLLSQAARIHPCAWVLMATVPFVVPAGDAGTWRRRLLVCVAAAVVSGGVLLLTSANVLLDVLANIRTGTVFRPDTPSVWPLAVIALAGAVYVRFARRPWLALPAGISVAAMVMTRQGFAASWIWQQSYFRLYLTLPLIAVIAWALPAVERRRWVALAAASMLLLVWLRFGWPLVSARTVEHLEYRWVRDQLERLPRTCRVVHLAGAGHRGLLLPTYVGGPRPAVAMDLRRPETVEAAFSPAPCIYYVHTSLCSTTDGRPQCETIERRLTLVPIARASFAVAREFATFSHDGDTVDTIITRVEGGDGR